MQLIKIDSRLDIAQKRAGPPVPLKATPALKSQTRNPEWESKINPEEFLRESANYTVQVASYKNRQAAQKEIEILKKRGMKPLILYKGKYLVVCVGSFPDRKAAQSLLWELKKRYGDCIVRRL
jgi:cell division septation protein DedD